MKKTILLLFALFGTMINAKAQNWGGGVDERNFHFGFTFQVLASEYKVLKNADWSYPYFDQTASPFDPAINPGLNRITSQEKPGYGLGFVVNKRMGKYTDLRFTPTLVFTNRVLNYVYAGPSNNRQQVVEATMLDMPLSFKLKSDRRKNFRGYLIGGLKYSMDMTSEKKRSNEGKTPMEMILRNKKNFLSYEAGLGMDLYFEYFKVSPELKYSSSFNDILDRDFNNPYAAPLNKLMLRHVTFSLFFE